MNILFTFDTMPLHAFMLTGLRLYMLLHSAGLHAARSGGRRYWEVVEIYRRVLYQGAISLAADSDGLSRVALGCALSLVLTAVAREGSPFINVETNTLLEACQNLILFTFLVPPHSTHRI